MSKKKKRRSKNKTNKISVILFVVVVLAVLGIGVYLGINYNESGNIHLETIERLEDYLEESLPDTVDNDLKLPLSLSMYPDISITWESSDEAYISKLGKVTQPTFDDVNRTVTLTAKFVIEDDGFLASFFYNLLGFNSKTKNFQISVLKKELTNQEKVDLVRSYLYVPSATTSDIGLTTKFPYFPNLTITWDSSDSSIIGSDGIINGLGSAVLDATIELFDIKEVIEFGIEVLDEFDSVIALEENFSNFDGEAKGKSWSESGFNFDRVNILDREDEFEPGEVSQYLRLHSNKDKPGYIEMTDRVENPQELKFNYRFYKKGIVSFDASFNIYVILPESGSAVEIGSYEITDLENIVEIIVDVSSYPDARFKIELVSGYADEIQILIYDILVTRTVNDNDIYNSLDKLVYYKVKDYAHFPVTTPYGGVVTWVSGDEDIITNDLLVKRASDSKKVTMTATITINGKDYLSSYEITVIGLNFVSPVEVFFIDIGKYGTSDAGEAIYIRIDEIDILVDAGQHSTSFQAISEVIDANSTDKILDYVIATHPDADHIGNMPKVFEKYQVLNVLQFYGTHTSNIYTNYMQAVEDEEGVNVCLVTDSIGNKNGCGSEIELKPEVEIQIVDTLNYSASETNSRSIVFVLEAYGTRVLLTGDADNGSIANLEAGYMNSVGDIDILKAVHHGTKEGTTAEFLEVVKPEVVIITNGNYFGNKHGHPTADAINRIYSYDNKTEIYALVGGGTVGCEVSTSGSYRCDNSGTKVDRNGTIKISINSSGYDIVADLSNMPIELSSTTWWKNHPNKEEWYQK